VQTTKYRARRNILQLRVTENGMPLFGGGLLGSPWRATRRSPAYQETCGRGGVARSETGHNICGRETGHNIAGHNITTLRRPTHCTCRSRSRRRTAGLRRPAYGFCRGLRLRSGACCLWGRTNRRRRCGAFLRLCGGGQSARA